MRWHPVARPLSRRVLSREIEDGGSVSNVVTRLPEEDLKFDEKLLVR
jgi:hypothetical protein